VSAASTPGLRTKTVTCDYSIKVTIYSCRITA